MGRSNADAPEAADGHRLPVATLDSSDTDRKRVASGDLRAVARQNCGRRTISSAILEKLGQGGRTAS